MQIIAYQEGTKINTEVNEEYGTHWIIRHRWFQQVPVFFSLAPGDP